MTDRTTQGRSPFPYLPQPNSPFTTSPFADVFSNYGQTTQGEYESEHWSSARPPENGYEGSEPCRLCFLHELCVCNVIGEARDDAAVAVGSGDWRETHQTGELESMEWDTHQGQGWWGTTDHGMAGTGQHQESTGIIVWPDDQIFQRPREIPAAGSMDIGPYSLTAVGANTEAHHHSGGPGLETGKQPWSPGSHGHGHDDGVDGELRMAQTHLEENFHPTRCLLPECRDRKSYVFTTLQRYRSHLKNVHTKDNYCHVVGCPRTNPFTSKNDLDRHFNAKHNPNPIKPFKCERPHCGARVKAWTRKDKLRGHNKKYHLNMPCQICSEYFDNFHELIEHTNLDHGRSGFDGGNV